MVNKFSYGVMAKELRSKLVTSEKVRKPYIVVMVITMFHDQQTVILVVLPVTIREIVLKKKHLRPKCNLIVMNNVKKDIAPRV